MIFLRTLKYDEDGGVGGGGGVSEDSPTLASRMDRQDANGK